MKFKQKSVYLAILNQGSIHTDLVKVLNVITQQEGYRIVLSYPTKKPITHNRNTITQQFLASDCDYLMMIDSDIVPPPNVMTLVDFDKDIITPLMFVRQQGKLLPLFLKMRKDGIHDVGDYLTLTGLQEVDATGTGCIIIKREVLENLKHPFRNEYDDDGIKTLGQDLSFCKRAQAMGFKSWVHLDYIASHYTSTDLKDVYMEQINKYKMEQELGHIKEYLKINNPKLLNKLEEEVLELISPTKNEDILHN